MIDTTVFQNKTAVYYTLGCKLNFSETSTIGKILREAGVRTARKGEKADICVVNTCSVTEMADKKCRQAIHRLGKAASRCFCGSDRMLCAIEARRCGKDRWSGRSAGSGTEGRVASISGRPPKA